VTVPSLVRSPVAPLPDPSAPSPTGRPALDTLGATASIVCAVHCVLVALAMGALPALGLFADPRIEWGFLAVSGGIGLVALVPAFGHHRNRAPLLAFVTGMLVLLATRLAVPAAPLAEAALVVIGASCLVWAHWRNRRLVVAHACRVPGHRH
jgi:hypothetical protein